MFQKSSHTKRYLHLLVIISCAFLSRCVTNQPKVPDSVKSSDIKYERLKVYGNRSTWTRSGLDVQRGQRILILASGQVNLNPDADYGNQKRGATAYLKYRIGDSKPFHYTLQCYFAARDAGRLSFLVSDNPKWYSNNVGSYRVDVFQIPKGEEMALAGLLEEFIRVNPEDHLLHAQIKNLYLAKKEDLDDQDNESLGVLYRDTIQNTLRTHIVWELEERKAVDTLIACLEGFYDDASDQYSMLDQETAANIVDLLEALGRLGNPQGVEVVSKYLYHGERKIRWQALEALGKIKTVESMDAVVPVLHDQDADIRMKALKSLDEIGKPEAVDYISLLLTDKRRKVQVEAENLLQKYGLSEAELVELKRKSTSLTLSEAYRSKRDYQRIKASGGHRILEGNCREGSCRGPNGEKRTGTHAGKGIRTHRTNR
jgi:hypothetical protein